VSYHYSAVLLHQIGNLFHINYQKGHGDSKLRLILVVLYAVEYFIYAPWHCAALNMHLLGAPLAIEVIKG
jgi:hypothetical protein